MKKQKLFFGLTFIILIVSQVNFGHAETGTVKYSLETTNLANPGDDHYEGWFITADEAIPAGKFSINDNGDVTDLDGKAIDSISVKDVDLSKVTKYVITLEPNGDTNTVPSDIKPVAGDFNADKTSATLSDNIGADFSSIFGKYILATPTDNNSDTNENAGIWYLSLESGSPAVGFGLPDLSSTNWIYEGWVIINGVPVTTGTFDDANVADNSAPYSATTVDGPPFPGEDFLVNAPTGLTFPVNITGMATALTIEPRVDNSADPFQFHILEAMIPSNAVDHTTYNMTDISNTLPTGTLEVLSSGSSDDSPGFNFVLAFVGIFTIAVITTKITKNKN